MSIRGKVDGAECKDGGKEEDEGKQHRVLEHRSTTSAHGSSTISAQPTGATGAYPTTNSTPCGSL